MTTDAPRHIVIDEIPTDYIPYEVGSVHVNDNGSVVVTPQGSVVRFRFAFDDIRFAALARRQDDAGHLRICGSVGVLPYSAESPGVRQEALDAIRESKTSADGHFIVSDNQNILFLSNLSVPLPFTPKGLLTQLVVELIEFRPLLARLRAILPTAA